MGGDLQGLIGGPEDRVFHVGQVKDEPFTLCPQSLHSLMCPYKAGNINQIADKQVIAGVFPTQHLHP